jgi:hypothetical protein
MGVILFPPGTIFLQILCGHRLGIKPLVRRSCTVNTPTGGALLVCSQRARAPLKSWAVSKLRRSDVG